MSLLKKVWIGLCVVVSSAQAGVTEEERQRGGYFYPSITPERCARVEALLQKEEGPLINSFKHHILPHLNLKELSQHPNFDLLQKFINHKAFLRVKEQFARGASHALTHYWEDPKTRDGQDNTVDVHLEVLRNALNNAYILKGQEGFFSEAAKQTFENERKQALVACEKRYNHSIGELCTNDALLRYWVVENVLFGPERAPEALVVWRALKKSELIQTLIPDDVKGWSYNLSTAVKESFIHNPHPIALTLGCGTSIFNQDENDDLTEYGSNLQGAIFSCVRCGETHKGELSIALPEEWQESPAYAPSSHATLRGDMFDEALWNGLGGYRFSLIKDHSYCHHSYALNSQLALLLEGNASTEESLENAASLKENYSRYAKNIVASLEKGGIFELLGIGQLGEDSYVIKIFIEAGLSLKEINSNRNRVIFHKL